MKAEVIENTDFRVSSAEFSSGATDVASLPAPTLAEIAFAGRSNVGKSSLLNAMMQRKSLCRTSNTPGCTRQINVFEVKTVGTAAEPPMHVYFVDLPGYGYAKRSKSEKSKWGPMLEGYLRERPTLRAVVVLSDVRRGLEDDDRDLIEFLKAPRATQSNKPLDIVTVATKIDKLALSARKPAMEAVRKVSGAGVIGFSAVTGDGREALWKRIRHAL